MDLTLFKLPQTVFSFKEVSLLYPDVSTNNLKSRLFYLVKTGKLLNLRRGIYAKQNYNPFELGNKIYSPSYISLQTVLEKEGIIFQPHQTIFLISYLSRKIEAGGYTFVYKKIKSKIALNPVGIEQNQNFAIASKERAFLDAVFLYKNYYVDNPDRLDGEKIREFLPIYNSIILEKRVKKYV